MKETKIGWQLKLLRMFCQTEYLEEIEGDLLERYEKNPSRIFITKEVFKLIRPRLMKSLGGTNRLNHYGMFKNQLISSFRFVKKGKAFTLMNIGGLAVGMACCLFIYLWLSDELLYNAHLEKGDRVCNVINRELQSNGDINTYRHSPFPLKAVLDENYPIIESSTILSNGNWMAFPVGEDLIEWAGVDATPDVFEIFEIKFLKGDFSDLLDNPQSFVISREFAEVYFGEDWESLNVVGRFMTNDEGETLELSGVFENLPKHSTLQFSFVVPFENRIKKRPNLKKLGKQLKPHIRQVKRWY